MRQLRRSETTHGYVRRAYFVALKYSCTTASLFPRCRRRTRRFGRERAWPTSSARYAAHMGKLDGLNGKSIDLLAIISGYLAVGFEVSASAESNRMT